MKVITCHIKLLEPALITGLEGDPNSSVSYDFVPGSVLRGALIGRYLQTRKRGELGADPGSWEKERRLFLDGSTHFLNGYLAKRHNRAMLRSLPSPKSWHRRKEDKQYNPELCAQASSTTTTSTDFAVAPPGPDDITQWVTAGNEFLVVAEQSPFFVNPDRQVRIETSRHRDYGRARRAGTDDEPAGAVYRYEALSAGQTFAAHIVCDDKDVDELTALLDSTVCLGGARSADYGRARLTPIKTEELSAWREVGHARLPNDKLGSQVAVVTLLSDLLWRNPHGQYAVDPHGLAAFLGLDLDRAYVTTREIGGFNRKWGLPLPQATAFRMGSVFVFRNVSGADMDKLRKLEREGIGDSRVDGFGRIALNWHGSAEIASLPTLSPGRSTAPTLTDPAARRVAGQIAERILQRQIDQRITARANELARGQKGLSKSQVYRLRLAVQASLQVVQANQTADLAAERQTVQRYLDSLSQRRSTQKQFERTRIGNQKLLSWIEQRLQETDQSKTLELIGLQTPAVIGGVTATLDDRALYVINLQLANAVLARLGKLAREDDR